MTDSHWRSLAVLPSHTIKLWSIVKRYKIERHNDSYVFDDLVVWESLVSLLTTA